MGNGISASWFARFATRAAHASGHSAAFILAFLIIIAWAVSGPIFGFSDTWQLVINTGTTIITFLMVFLIQNTQNRGEDATHRGVGIPLPPGDLLSASDKEGGKPADPVPHDLPEAIQRLGIHDPYDHLLAVGLPQLPHPI